MNIILLNVLAKNFLLDEEGATAVEYALLAALFGATLIGGATGLGSALDAMYTDAVATLSAALGS